MPHVFFRNPGRMTFDLETEVALLEQNGCAITAQHRIAQTGLEPVPAGRQRAGEIADIFVVHAQERAEAVLFHHRASPLGTVFSQPVPVDPLLPIHSGDAEIRSHSILPARIPRPSPVSEKSRACKRFGAIPLWTDWLS